MKRILALLAVTVLLSSCLDDPIPPQQYRRPELPQATTSGANTFGAIVSDTIWEGAFQPSQGIISASPNARYVGHKLGVFALRRSNVNSPVAYFDLELEGVVRTGTYALGSQLSPSGTARYAVLGTLVGGVDYVTDSTATGTVTITKLDTASRVPYVSGRFVLQARKRVALTAVPAEAATLPTTVVVDSGRFDVQFNRP